MVFKIINILIENNFLFMYIIGFCGNIFWEEEWVNLGIIFLVSSVIGWIRFLFNFYIVVMGELNWWFYNIILVFFELWVLILVIRLLGMDICRF